MPRRLREFATRTRGRIENRLYHHKRMEFLAIAKERRVARRPPETDLQFFVLSCERNGGLATLKCLDSVYEQDFPNPKVTHYLIDDDSGDETPLLIEAWLKEHSDHNVQLVKNKTRKGGAQNTYEGFIEAPPGSIVLEVNGDDWLPNADVIPFLSKVYSDPNVWCTYNSMQTADGVIYDGSRRLSYGTIRHNEVRRAPWVSTHLKTFRQELGAHIDRYVFVDPDTDDFWENADDQAYFLTLLELAGWHSRHIFRVLYVYNETGSEITRAGITNSAKDRVKRIRAMPPRQPLMTLSG